MEEAFWGQHYWDWIWVVTSEMERCMSMYVCMCLCVCALLRICLKKESGAALNDRWMDKKGVQREKQNVATCGGKELREGMKGEKVVGTWDAEKVKWKKKNSSATNTTATQRGRGTSCLQWDTLEVSVRSISTIVLAFSTWLPSLVFLSVALSLLDVSACSVIHQASASHSQLMKVVWVCQVFDLQEVTAFMH